MGNKYGYNGKMGGGAGGMQNLMKQAQQMQQKLMEAQQQLEELEVVGTASGGLVSITCNGKKEILAVSIKPEAVDPDDVEMLEDLVLSAVNEALKKADEETSNKMGKLTGGLNIPGMF